MIETKLVWKLFAAEKPPSRPKSFSIFSQVESRYGLCIIAGYKIVNNERQKVLEQAYWYDDEQRFSDREIEVILWAPFPNVKNLQF